MLQENSMTINTALLKYSYQNFSLTILEFCGIDDLMLKEKHYFDLYSPEYNILKTPGSPSRGSGWQHSEATIEKVSLAARERYKSYELIDKLSKSQIRGINVEVTNITINEVTSYNAIRAAARALGLNKKYIENYIFVNSNQPVLGKYTFKLLNENKNNVTPKIQSTSLKLEVTDIETNNITMYYSIGEAGRALDIRQASISLYLKDKIIKPFRGKYLLKLV
jgi:group I intron endonuclease